MEEEKEVVMIQPEQEIRILNDFRRELIELNFKYQTLLETPDEAPETAIEKAHCKLLYEIDCTINRTLWKIKHAE